MDAEYATYPQSRREERTSLVTIMFCCVAAVAITLAAVSVSKANNVDRRMDNFITKTSGSSSSGSAAPSYAHLDVPSAVSALASANTSLLSDLSKASSALGLHSYCQSNAQMCANVVESFHRLTEGFSCDKVRNGDYSFGGVDVVVSSSNKVQCAGPKFSAKEGTAPATPSKCDLELTGVCVYGGSDSNINVLFHKEANSESRRGQGSFDANAGWNQQSGASVSVGFHYTWGSGSGN